jgi:hypothetical protein
MSCPSKTENGRVPVKSKQLLLVLVVLFYSCLFLCPTGLVAVDLHLCKISAESESMADGIYGVMSGMAVLLSGVARLLEASSSRKVLCVLSSASASDGDRHFRMARDAGVPASNLTRVSLKPVPALFFNLSVFENLDSPRYNLCNNHDMISTHARSLDCSNATPSASETSTGGDLFSGSKQRLCLQGTEDLEWPSPSPCSDAQLHASIR